MKNQFLKTVFLTTSFVFVGSSFAQRQAGSHFIPFGGKSNSQQLSMAQTNPGYVGYLTKLFTPEYSLKLDRTQNAVIVKLRDEQKTIKIPLKPLKRELISSRGLNNTYYENYRGLYSGEILDADGFEITVDEMKIEPEVFSSRGGALYYNGNIYIGGTIKLVDLSTQKLIEIRK